MGGNTMTRMDGGSNSKLTQEGYVNELNQNFTYINTKYGDQKYGDIKIYEERFPQPGQIRQKVMLLEVTNNDEGIFNILRNKIRRRADTNHPNLANLVNSYSTIEKKWCMDYFIHYILYEYCPLTLENELHDRSKLSSHKSALKVINL